MGEVQVKRKETYFDETLILIIALAIICVRSIHRFSTDQKFEKISLAQNLANLESWEDSQKKLAKGNHRVKG